MSQLIKQYQSFNQDGLELVINVATGEAFASQRSTARMLGMAWSTFQGKGGREYTTQTAEIITGGGLQGGRLISAQDIFKLALKYNLELAEQMGTAGATVYLYGLAGYVVKPVEKQPDGAVDLAQWHEQRLQGIQVRHDLTYMIKLLVQYAEAAGSSNAHYYFTHFSNLVNKYVILDGTKKAMSKIKNKRNRMSKRQLHYVEAIETTLAKLIGDGMAKGSSYTQVYEDCKVRASAIAAVLDIEPKPLLAKSNRKAIEAKLNKSLPAA